MKTALFIVTAFMLAVCVGTTGGGIIDFPAAAAGPRDAVEGQPLVFTTDRGWTVTLTKATLHVGAVYLDRSIPVSGAGNTDCILSPETYVAQVTSGLDVDLLSPSAQPFPTGGHGITGSSLLAQVWLTGGDINATDDLTRILQMEGTAQRASDVRPFVGVVTIGSNRQTSGQLAGANPPCKQRIAAVPAHVDVRTNGALLVRIDPRQLFLAVDFAHLTRPANSSTYLFQDNSADPASSNLYSNLHSGGTLYTFEWVDSL